MLSVFSTERGIASPRIDLPRGVRLNERLKMDGLVLLSGLDADMVPVCFFDPQYRGVLDKMRYGNEGQGRSGARCALPQMDEAVIAAFIEAIDRVLMPTGHLFLWIDKFHLCQGVHAWLEKTRLDIVDLVVWDKGIFGNGYRTRRQSEYCMVLQKAPRKAKGVWKVHNIPDVVKERQLRQKAHIHQKPIGLQGALLAAVSNEGDVVLDPAAGSFSVMEAALEHGRNFLGCDVNG